MLFENTALFLSLLLMVLNKYSKNGEDKDDLKSYYIDNQIFIS